MQYKIDNLLINPNTIDQIDSYLKRPAYALMLIGLPGSGKTAIAHAIAADILKTDNLKNYPNFLHITRPKDKQDIPIEDIRAVLHKLRLRTTGKRTIRRIVFIEDAQLLSTEAQNALLRAIEEPASDTVFILSVDSSIGVLPTIASRTQRLNIQPVILNQAQQYYKNQKGETEINSAWQLSQGGAGLLHALLFESKNHPLKIAVEQAKALLAKNPYERIIELDKLNKDKEQLFMLLVALGKVLAALNRAAVNKESSQKSLIAGRRLVQQLQEALQANVSPRLVALELALNLKI